MNNRGQLFEKIRESTPQKKRDVLIEYIGDVLTKELKESEKKTNDATFALSGLLCDALSKQIIKTEDIFHTNQFFFQLRMKLINYQIYAVDNQGPDLLYSYRFEDILASLILTGAQLIGPLKLAALFPNSLLDIYVQSAEDLTKKLGQTTYKLEEVKALPDSLEPQTIYIIGENNDPYYTVIDPFDQVKTGKLNSKEKINLSTVLKNTSAKQHTFIFEFYNQQFSNRIYITPDCRQHLKKIEQRLEQKNSDANTFDLEKTALLTEIDKRLKDFTLKKRLKNNQRATLLAREQMKESTLQTLKHSLENLDLKNPKSIKTIARELQIIRNDEDKMQQINIFNSCLGRMTQKKTATLRLLEATNTFILNQVDSDFRQEMVRIETAFNKNKTVLLSKIQKQIELVRPKRFSSHLPQKNRCENQYKVLETLEDILLSHLDFDNPDDFEKARGRLQKIQKDQRLLLYVNDPECLSDFFRSKTTVKELLDLTGQLIENNFPSQQQKQRKKGNH